MLHATLNFEYMISPITPALPKQLQLLLSQYEKHRRHQRNRNGKESRTKTETPPKTYDAIKNASGAIKKPLGRK